MIITSLDFGLNFQIVFFKRIPSDTERRSPNMNANFCVGLVGSFVNNGFVLRVREVIFKRPLVK